MVDATFAITSDIVVNTVFNGLITFAGDVTLFDETDITLTAVDGNGITGVTFTVTQQTPSTYSINFTLPSDAEGEFSVQATGMVLLDGATIEQAINANPSQPIVHYDTSIAVAATWGTPDYTVDDEDGQIAIPITFASGVVIEDLSVFQVTPVSPLTDDDLRELDFSLSKTSDTDWTLTLTFPLDLDGDVEVDITGEVFKITSMVNDSVTISALTLTVNTLIPEVIRRVQLGTYTHGEMYDVIWRLNVEVEFYDPRQLFNNPSATEQNFFVFSGAQLGTPMVYVYTNTGFPSLPLPETLSADWELLFKMNASTPPSSVLLMRYSDVPDTAVGATLVEVKNGVYYNPGS